MPVGRVTHFHSTIKQLFEYYIDPVWDYGKNDRTIRRQMSELLEQLLFLDDSSVIKDIIARIDCHD